MRRERESVATPEDVNFRRGNVEAAEPHLRWDSRSYETS